jgi:hypothetical protein
VTAHPNKPTIPEVAPVIAAYVKKPGNDMGGSLHIVLDDGNIESHHVEFCRNYARDQGDEDGEKLAELLLQMSASQRRRLCVKPGWEAWTEDRNGHPPQRGKWIKVRVIKTIQESPGDPLLIKIQDTSGQRYVFSFDPTTSQHLAPEA